MRTHRKPDLLFVLAVIVGIGVAVSSYIQYMRANAPDESELATKQLVQQKSAPETAFILVSTQPEPAMVANGDPVNNSLPRP